MTDTSLPENTKPAGLLIRLWRRLTRASLPPEQAELLSKIKFPCC
ncbi:MAG: hypothetical protein AB3N24_23920 [Leisingera sp.]